MAKRGSKIDEVFSLRWVMRDISFLPCFYTHHTSSRIRYSTRRLALRSLAVSECEKISAEYRIGSRGPRWPRRPPRHSITRSYDLIPSVSSFLDWTRVPPRREHSEHETYVWSKGGSDAVKCEIISGSAPSIRGPRHVGLPWRFMSIGHEEART